MARPSDRSRASADPDAVATHFFFEAIPAWEGGYTARYGIPGLLPTRIKDDDGNIMLFGFIDEAELAAARAMADVLTSRSRSLRQSKPESYQKMTGVELAVALDEVKMSPTLLAYLVGTDPKRILKWLEDPEEDVPHQVRLLLGIFKAYPETIDVAEEITESVASRKAPR